ncbi:unnamed protein product [Arabis nemorensis]|uniref:Uncharacterized protein n=1 Tax=Arabis nemorensis TaxID=586526 RepID=A0A565CP88_9BRAS|nr:unnamed protein product [Arabis nemorensis]
MSRSRLLSNLFWDLLSFTAPCHRQPWSEHGMQMKLSLGGSMVFVLDDHHFSNAPSVEAFATLHLGTANPLQLENKSRVEMEILAGFLSSQCY